jgi:hypothetical protein
VSAHKVLIVAEGRSEIGDLDALRAPTRRRPTCEGYIPPMLRKLLDLPIEVYAQKVISLRGPNRKPPLPGHADRAAKALALASSDGCALLVFVKDVDRATAVKKSRTERRNKLKEMHEQIEDGFAAVKDAEDTFRVKATPCRMIEAWALGDAAAISAVGGKRAQPSEVPARPELIWGDEDDPKSGHPKCTLRRAVGCDVTAEVLERIAEQSSPTKLVAACPESFAPFTKDVETARKRLLARSSP